MPINVPDGLPSIEILKSENIFVMSERVAAHQDFRPLKIVILNIMPTKEVTETQLARVLSNTPIQVDITFMRTSSYISKTTSEQHLSAFYKSFAEIEGEKFDGMIITGAPVENMEFEEVGYWGELCGIMDWAKRSVYSCMYICWGAQAGLYYNYGIPKYRLPRKLSGVYSHTVLKPGHELVRGFDEVFLVPHSRYTEVRLADLERVPDLEVLTFSEEAGAHIAASRDGRGFYVTGHSEYDAETLGDEYRRDLGKGIGPELPVNYFPEDDPGKRPLNRWRAHANLLFSNWLNYFVYQETPYNIDEIKQ